MPPTAIMLSLIPAVNKPLHGSQPRRREEIACDKPALLRERDALQAQEEVTKKLIAAELSKSKHESPPKGEDSK